MAAKPIEKGKIEKSDKKNKNQPPEESKKEKDDKDKNAA